MRIERRIERPIRKVSESVETTVVLLKRLELEGTNSECTGLAVVVLANTDRNFHGALGALRNAIRVLNPVALDAPIGKGGGHSFPGFWFLKRTREYLSIKKSIFY